MSGDRFRRGDSVSVFYRDSSRRGVVVRHRGSLVTVKLHVEGLERQIDIPEANVHLLTPSRDSSRPLPGPKPKKYRRPAKPRKSAFGPGARVAARWGTRTPSGAWVSRGAKGTVEGISSSRTKFVVKWDTTGETGWYEGDDLE